MDSFVGLFGPDSLEETNSSSFCKIPEFLPPEAAEGNVEYKLKLVNPSKSRFEHLVTQMKWRLREGQGEAIYTIGVSDAGKLIGLDEEEMQESLNTLYRMAEKLGADITSLGERYIDDNLKRVKKTVAEFLVRKVPDDQQSIELRVAVLGGSDVGKSTLLGVLTQGEKDNGHGSARLNLFRHLHEIQSGRTSSISHEILGFDSQGSAMTYSTCRTAEEICDNSKKLITFIDLAGHKKYLKTTVFGLTGHSPHFAVLVISAVSGLSGITKEHLGLATVVDIPIVVVINKIDIATPACLKRTLQQLEELLQTPGYKKLSFQVFTEEDALAAASSFASDKIIPIFSVSCVTGKGLDLLYTFLNILPPTINQKDRELLMQKPAEFQIDETFHVPDVGLVVSGLLTSGIIHEGDKLLVGPSDSGHFNITKVLSLHRHKVPSRIVRACESATLALSSQDIPLRKGMVLISQQVRPPVCYYFQAKIQILFHTTNICSGFQASVHIGNVRQTATILGIMGRSSLSVNDTASVIFKFIQRPECVHPGSKLLLRVGQTKAIGRVTQVFLLGDNLPLKVSPIHQ
ncbi:GTP-binding protein 2-like [Argiope bruennichi]|uniref:GTP-binding protein 2 like protein n=1 Tax=Argiope bruennichi TaxID=94029 RepID=A0A8T0F0Q7_ARGBR|nr:GTP-binding protein 2-like [Argiope bruennichi]XP_055927026.1 GTP-binding protein 2-like [Argiope bruennichi]KAF8784716.1 GTP-binding protein 2 like protein [Argiope bruennichi]